MIAIIDYGMGNLRSVQKAFEKVGAQTLITQNKKDIESAKSVVLPGVGAMQPAMDKLNALELTQSIKEVINVNKPFLGICLGLQLLFESSSEGGDTKGLGVLKGNVEKFSSLKVPHMGWNEISLAQTQNPLFKNIKNGAHVYFCHSYFVVPQDKNVIATTTDYGREFISSITYKNLFGVQFHPEKSQEVGLQILRNFKDLTS